MFKVLLFVGVALFALMAANLAFNVVEFAYSPAVYTRNAAKCNDGNVCTGDYVTPRQTCVYEPLAAATACSSACYTSGTTTACDGQGACVGDSADCLGYCEGESVNGPDYPMYATNNTYCDSVIPFWSEVITYNWTTSYGDSLDVLDYDCIANQCIKVAISLVNQYSPSFHWGAFTGMYLDCMDYIDTNQTDVDTSCITATSYVIDNDVLSRYANLMLDGNASLGNGFDARVCAYRYSCGAFTTKIPYVPVNKRVAGNKKEAAVVGTFFGGSARVKQSVEALVGKALERLPRETLTSYVEEATRKKRIVS